MTKREKIAVAACCLVFALFIGFTTTNSQVVSASSTVRDLPIYNVSVEDKVCSLSFDAAWGNEDTQDLIDILASYDIKATFFVVGDWVDKYPESVKALYDAGHEIMNHSDSHPYMTQLSASEMLEEISVCNDKIEAITGEKPILFRPPYGDYNDLLVSTLRDNGMYAIQWNIDSLDWKDPTPAEMQERIMEKIVPGSILLFHNAAVNTPDALPGIIEALINEGYSFEKISDLIYKENYTIDNAGMQIENT